MNNINPKILILGIGNFLLGDEGVGVHAVQLLEKENFSRAVSIVDGGCGGFNLMQYFKEFPTIIMIDATMDGSPAGKITLLEPEFASDFPKSLSAHDIGLRDLVESAALIGDLPKIYLITISISEIQSMTTELSQPVRDSLVDVISCVSLLLETI
jgi:hydrogenase maturation protease